MLHHRRVFVVQSDRPGTHCKNEGRCLSQDPNPLGKGKTLDKDLWLLTGLTLEPQKPVVQTAEVQRSITLPRPGRVWAPDFFEARLSGALSFSGESRRPKASTGLLGPIERYKCASQNGFHRRRTAGSLAKQAGRQTALDGSRSRHVASHQWRWPQSEYS